MLATVVSEKQYPPEGPPEIAFAGRSNVGKSSLLNLLTNRKSLARVSGNPGKTRTINFYMVNGDEFRIVDLPGYGYAKASRSITKDWGAMIETYLKKRGTLRKVALLVDIRHEPSVQDKQMYEWISYYGMGGLVVATKADKISRNSLAKNLKIISTALGLTAADTLLPVSVLNRTGVDDLLEAIGNVVE
jgi:GTP-binding protein